jgi:hypothetical protein
MPAFLEGRTSVSKTDMTRDIERRKDPKKKDELAAKERRKSHRADRQKSSHLFATPLIDYVRLAPFCG